jgi:energy-coupling factor transporter ATP-binding protein EcfA2
MNRLNQIANKDLTLGDGSKLKWLEKSSSQFLNKTTILYGMTASGKSTIIAEILHLIQNYISGGYVICQSVLTVESSDFYGIFPNHCIKSSITPEWVLKFLDIQKGRASIYKTANDINNLKLVFDRIKDSKSDSFETNIIHKANDFINNITNNISIEFADKMQKCDTVKQELESNLIKLYKFHIRKYKIKLEKMSNLTSGESCCINYLDFNPNVLIVWDDCASMFKEWAKKCPPITEIFYNGRHYYITQIISTQNDTEIDAKLRKNTRVSIFTEMQSASSNFERKSNNFPKQIVKRSSYCIDSVFSSNMNSKEKNYKKLVYIQGDSFDPFRYTIADKYDNVKIGCDALWELDKKMNEIDKTDESDNMFFNKYYDQ